MKKNSILIILLIFTSGFILSQKGEIKIPLMDDAFITELNSWDALKAGKDNRIYIADRRNYQIKIFSPDGKYISSFGRRGEGPGEFKRWFGEYDIGDDGNIYQADFWGGNSSVSIFDPDGKYLKRIKVVLNLNFGIGDVQKLNEDKFILQIHRDQILKRMSNIIFMGSNIFFTVVDSKGKITKELFKEFEYHSFSISETGGWPSIPYRIDSISTFFKPLGLIAYQKNCDDTIWFYNIHTDEKFNFKNGFLKEKVTKNDIKDFIDKYVTPIRTRQRFLPYYKKLMALGRTVEEYKPIISGMLFDAEGNLNIFSKKHDGLYKASIISPDKGLLKKYQTISAPSLITRDKTYYLTWDDDEELYNLIIKKN